jgi:rhodanese-related sulfurtransferase
LAEKAVARHLLPLLLDVREESDEPLSGHLPGALGLVRLRPGIDRIEQENLEETVEKCRRRRCRKEIDYTEMDLRKEARRLR